MNPEDRDLFDTAHQRLDDLIEHPTIQGLVGRFLAGALTLTELLEEFLSVPEVQAVLIPLGSAALEAVPGIGLIAAPLWPFALKAIAALVKKRVSGANATTSS